MSSTLFGDSGTDSFVLSAYSRSQAIEDGFLADVSPLAREAGFRVPVALTSAVSALLTPTEADEGIGQRYDGRLAELLFILRLRARETEGDTVRFAFLMRKAGGTSRLELKAMMGPGDTAEPVLTIMLPDED